jgi:uncharacterized LabA/DUF88 family protein
MASNTQGPAVPAAPDEPQDATLVFHEQADGRKVARLPGGKVVLVDLKAVDRVGDGEAWYVKLRHRESFAVAEPVERVTAAALEAESPTLRSSVGDAYANRRTIVLPAKGVSPTPAAPAAESLGTAPEPPSAPPPVTDSEPVVPAVDIGRILRPTDRVALFIDGANMDGASRSAGYFIDYRLAREYFVGPATFYAAFYYVADFAAADGLQQRFFDFLSHAGYIVRRRPVKVITDIDTGEKVIKGNLDTEIVLDLVNTVQNYDVAFLFSGDSDFERAVDLLRSRGKRIYVVSSRSSISRELSYVADKPIFLLEDHRDRLMRTDRAPRP